MMLKVTDNQYGRLS